MKLQYKEALAARGTSRYPQPRLQQHRPPELLTLTPWLAPIGSKGTFDPELLHRIYQLLNLSTVATAFAAGKYTQFVQHFLESAEFFMPGYQVHSHTQWEGVSMREMETISQHIAKRAHQEPDYLFCLNVNMVFQNPWGPETLGNLVAVIHPGYFTVPRQQFPYEHRWVSTAFVGDDERDFYYGGAAFGGQVADVYEFTRGCHMATLADKANGIMAVWQEESHVNCCLSTHKPSKVLSPVYIWDDRKPVPPSLKLIHFSTLVKDTSWLRG